MRSASEAPLLGGAGGRNIGVGFGLPVDEDAIGRRFRSVVGGLSLRSTGAPPVVVVVVVGGLRIRRTW